MNIKEENGGPPLLNVQVGSGSEWQLEDVAIVNQSEALDGWTSERETHGHPLEYRPGEGQCERKRRRKRGKVHNGRRREKNVGGEGVSSLKENKKKKRIKKQCSLLPFLPSPFPTSCS
jgi:hypothetical protein